MILVRKALLAALFLLAISPKVFADEIVVAAASDLGAAAKDLIADFEKRTGHTVKLSLGSSGNFHTQIRNGAPFDVFLSADVNYVRELEKAGLTEASSSFIYAIGRIVLWVPATSRLPVERGLQVLASPDLRKIAIANPRHAPYGRAAEAALRTFGVYDAVKDRLVLGENIAQTAQFVQTGNAEAGVVALSLVLAPPVTKVGHWIEIPPDSYPRLEQGAIITAHGAKNPLAPAYLAFLRSPEARAILDRYGFRLPK